MSALGQKQTHAQIAMRAASSGYEENTLGFSHTPFRFSRSRERLDHARQGPGDLVNYERNSQAIAECRERERTHDKEASRRLAVATDRSTGFVDIESNAERRDTAETVLEYGSQKRVFRGVWAGSKSDAVDHLVNNNGLALTRDTVAPRDLNARRGRLDGGRMASVEAQAT